MWYQRQTVLDEAVVETRAIGPASSETSVVLENGTHLSIKRAHGITSLVMDADEQRSYLDTLHDAVCRDLAPTFAAWGGAS